MKIFLLLILSVFISLSGFAQSFAGRTLLTGTMSVGSFKQTSFRYSYNGTEFTSRSTDLQLAPAVVIGKVNSHDLLIAYGASVQYSRNKGRQDYGDSTGDLTAKTHQYRVAPVLFIEKFLPVTDRIFFTPLARASVGYTKKRDNNDDATKAIDAEVMSNPLSLTFAIRPRTNLLIMAGQLGFGYSRQIYDGDDFAPGSKPRQHMWTATASLDYFALGLQICL